jgi:flagellar biosynthesis anti-sigma factor FlgM
MRIDLNQTVGSQIATEQNSKQVNASNASASGVAGGEDRTTFTSDTQSLSSLVNAVMSMPEIREDKVASLQQAISNGSYQLDPGQIASSMIDEHA